MKSLAKIIATCGPAGYSKFAPGTMGSLVALPVIVLLQPEPLTLIIASVLVFIISIWSADVTIAKAANAKMTKIISNPAYKIFLANIFDPPL